MGFEFILLSIDQYIACVSGMRARWHQLLHHNTCISRQMSETINTIKQTNNQTSERSREKKLRIALALASVFTWIFYVADDQMWEIDYVIGVCTCYIQLRWNTVFHWNSTNHLDISHCIVCIDAFFHLNAFALEKNESNFVCVCERDANCALVYYNIYEQRMTRKNWTSTITIGSRGVRSCAAQRSATHINHLK